MAFEEVLDLDCDTTTAIGGFNKKTGKKNPTEAEGYYLGSKEVDSKKSKTGKAKLHIFQTANGSLGVWGKTDLDRKMSNVVAGAMTRITQSGTVPTPNGDMYKYKVAQDKSNTIEVGFLSKATSEESSNTGFEEDGSDEDLFEETSEDEIEALPPAPTPPVKRAVAATTDRQAQIQAMISSRKTAKAAG